MLLVQLLPETPGLPCRQSFRPVVRRETERQIDQLTIGGLVQPRVSRLQLFAPLKPARFGNRRPP